MTGVLHNRAQIIHGVGVAHGALGASTQSFHPAFILHPNKNSGLNFRPIKTLAALLTQVIYQAKHLHPYKMFGFKIDPVIYLGGFFTPNIHWGLNLDPVKYQGQE